MMKRKELMELLEKLGLSHTGKISKDRIDKKIMRAFEEDEDILDGVEIAEEEMEYLRSLGVVEEEEDEDWEEPEEDVEEDWEDEEDPPEEPKKKSKKSAKKKEKAEKPKSKKKAKEPKEKRPGRWDTTITVLKKRKKHTLEQIAEESNDLYAKAGGKDNRKEAEAVSNRVVQILSQFEVLTVSENGAVKML